jgi:hypothetical protein
MFSVFVLTYQEVDDLEIDTKSKKWDLVPRSSDHLNSISISNKTLYYLAREARIFDRDEIGRVLLPNGREEKLLDKYVVSSGFHRILWHLCFHTSIQEALRAKQGVARIKFQGDEVLVGKSLITNPDLPTVVTASQEPGCVCVGEIDTQLTSNDGQDPNQRVVFAHFATSNGIDFNPLYYVLKEDPNDEENLNVRRDGGPNFGKKKHMMELQRILQLPVPEEPVVDQVGDNETLEQSRRRKKKNRKKKKKYLKVMEKREKAQGVYIAQGDCL